jgi:CRP-like cAMP-binding protein
MTCSPEVLRHVPLFALLDDEEMAVLAGQVELKTFAPRQRIYKIGDPSASAYVMVSGAVRVTTIDEDQQEVLVDEPRLRPRWSGEASGRASRRTRRTLRAGRGPGKTQSAGNPFSSTL